MIMDRPAIPLGRGHGAPARRSLVGVVRGLCDAGRPTAARRVPRGFVFAAIGQGVKEMFFECCCCMHGNDIRPRRWAA